MKIWVSSSLVLESFYLAFWRVRGVEDGAGRGRDEGLNIVVDIAKRGFSKNKNKKSAIAQCPFM